jgi:plastocyanin
MAQQPIRQLRLRNFASAALDSILGSRGDIYYDQTTNTLRIFDGATQGGVKLARADLSNVTTSSLRAKSIEAGMSTVVYTVSIVGPQSPDTGNKYQFNGVYKPQPTWVVGYTYVFVQDDPTNVYFPNTNGTTPNPHPLNFSSDNLSGVRGGGTSYLTNVTYFLDGSTVTQAVYNSSAFNTATSRQVWITITNSTPATLYYWCWNHSAMGNSATVADPGTGGGGSTTVITNNIENSYSFSVAGDDSTLREISNGESIKFQGAGGIAVTTDADGNITITGTGSTGNITFVGNVIDSQDSTSITVTPAVNFESDVVVGNEIVFADGSRQSTSAVGIPGPTGPIGPQGASGAGSGDVLSAGGGYVDNRIVRYDGVTGTIIQVSSASISDAGLLTATSFSGDGSLITALNATELTSGTIPNARFPATLPAVSGVNLTALPATLPAASGVNLTSLNATQLTSGTIPDDRFPATLPAVSGTNLTALNATQLTSGSVPIGRLGSSGTPSSSTYLRGDNTWATVSGGAASDSFATIAVSGQSSVVADSATDTLTLVAGSNITITTDASTDTITIAAAGGGGVASNSFETIQVAGQSNVVADSAADTLTLAAGTGISITTNASTDTVTITNTASAGATAFTGLSDRSDLTVDQFYLPAITRLNVTANGVSAYRFDQYGTADNPTIYAISGTTIAFNLTGSSTHPFLIRFSGANYNTGLVHVTTAGVVTTGTDAQGKQSGTLYWKIPAGISGTYGYLCGSHGGMVGTITIKDISAI